jgi:RimJ/RimL family protein N-acetyltransferase
VALARLAEQGVHPPEQMPFFVAWTDGIGNPGFVDGFVEHHHGLRRDWSPERWWLNLGAFRDGEPLGTQGMRGDDFVRTRSVDTGSWLGQRHQRQGIGTEMRTAVLALAFEGLGALAATSGWLEGNLGSKQVSERLGYAEVGEGVASPRGVPVREHKMRLERAVWEARDRPSVEITGLEPCLPLFGL